MISITVNGEHMNCSEATTIIELVQSLKQKPGGTVVELNGEIIKRELWPETIIKAHDMLEIVTFVGGG